MIQLSRQTKPPELAAEEATLIAAFKADNKKAVWSKPYIRAALLAMSNNKCCYCECRVGHGEREMHVDHFKPKSIYPDLVVDWDNLFPSCPYCNKQKSDHDTVAEPIVNPVQNNPKDFFYLKDYRYFCFDNTESSVARNTLGVLSLNDSTENVYKRYVIGNELHNKIDEISELVIDKENELTSNTRIKNKVINGCRDILKQGLPNEVYSAFMSTLIANDVNFNACVSVLKRQNLWNEELEKFFQIVINSSFKTSKAG